MSSKKAESIPTHTTKSKSKPAEETLPSKSELRDILGDDVETPSGKQGVGHWKFESIGGFFIPAEDVSKMTVQRQEQLLIRDLIYAFSGVPSTYIRPEFTEPEVVGLRVDQIDKLRFKIDDRFSGAFRTLVNELMPLIGYYIGVQSFIEQTSISTGCIRALGIAAQKRMQDYFELQAGLETQLHEHKLNLQQLVQQVRPWLTTMECLASMISRVRSSKLNTAQLLSVMHDYQEHFKCEHLTPLITEVSHHYMKMVQLWTQKGVLYDVRKEFFVEDTDPNAMSSTLLAPQQCCHEYWLKRYRLHVQRIPSFLEPHIEHIFLAGKYLNVLRQCNVQMQLMQASLSYVMGDQTHVQLIRSSYELPARKLLLVLIKEGHLLEHLQTLEAYFLLQDKEFIGSVLDTCTEQLLNHVDLLKPEKLQKAMLRILQESHDPQKKRLSSQLMNYDVVTEMVRYLKRHKMKPEGQNETDSDTEAAEDETANKKKDEKDQMDADEKKDVKVQEECSETKQRAKSDESQEQLCLYGYEAFSLRYEPNWPASLVLHEEALDDLRLLHRVLFYMRFVLRQMNVTLENMPNTSILYGRMMESINQLEQHMVQDILRPRWLSMLTNAKKAEFVDELIDEFSSTLELCLKLCFTSEPVTFVRSIYTLGQLCLNYRSFVEREASGEGFDRDWIEYEQEFNCLLTGILDLLRELARPNSASDNEERLACQQLLLRFEDVSREMS